MGASPQATASASSNGIGFTGTLFMLLLAFKLLHVISWSWWWITAPLWGSAALVTVLLGLAFAAVIVKCWSE
ncbi:hypothetical protein ACIP5Y_21660 [Nocardia sp. NPDC088792]|uniref:hypothetical protein n=1 Tax=Nocardia sp. NPDC088792 TaxID=3364332 RepID=UPI00381CEB48